MSSGQLLGQLTMCGEATSQKGHELCDVWYVSTSPEHEAFDHIIKQVERSVH